MNNLRTENLTEYILNVKKLYEHPCVDLLDSKGTIDGFLLTCNCLDSAVAMAIELGLSYELLLGDSDNKMLIHL